MTSFICFIDHKSEIDSVEFLIKSIDLPKDVKTISKKNILYLTHIELRATNKEYIDKNAREFIKLFESNKKPFDLSLLDQIIQKIRPDVIN